MAESTLAVEDGGIGTAGLDGAETLNGAGEASEVETGLAKGGLMTGG
jgi:hypothetical protein